MPGFDLIMQGIGGVMHRGDEQPEVYRYFPPPIWPPACSLPMPSVPLYHRERTGKGQLIDTALFATMLCLQSGILFFGEDPPPFVIHEIAPYIPTYRAYRDSEDNSSPWPRSEEQWRRLCRVADVPDIGADPRFDSLHKRVNNAEELIPLLQHKFAQHPRQHWITAMNEQQIPSGPVYSHDDLRQRRTSGKCISFPPCNTR